VCWRGGTKQYDRGQKLVFSLSKSGTHLEEGKANTTKEGYEY